MIPHDRRADDGVMERVRDSKGYRAAHPRPRSSREPGKRRSSVKVTPVFSIHQSDFSFKRTIGTNLLIILEVPVLKPVIRHFLAFLNP